MRQFTDAGRDAVAANNLYAALSLALIMPDICGSIVEPGPGKSEARYKRWFDDWAMRKFSYPPRDDCLVEPILTGADCYQLRCTVIHSGLPDDFNVKKTNINKVMFFDDSTTNHMNMLRFGTDTGTETVLQLNAKVFSGTMYDCVDEWDQATVDDPVLTERKRALLPIHSAGYRYRGMEFG